MGRSLPCLLMIALTAAAPVLWPSAARPADLLASVDFVDSAAGLGCIYADASNGYRLACIDARRYTEFDLQCEFDFEGSLVTSPAFHGPTPNRKPYRFVCLVTREQSVGGNALQLDCTTIVRSLEAELRFKRVFGGNRSASRFVLEGYILPAMSCTAVKIDLLSDDSGGAVR